MELEKSYDEMTPITELESSEHGGGEEDFEHNEWK